MIWYSLVIPLVISGITWVIWHKKVTLAELFGATVVSALFVLISFYTMKSISLSDVEYNGYTVIKARHYDYWSTWVSRTCSRTVCTGSGKTRTCHTYYYDCSYCDENSEYWVMYDSGGHEIRISREYYNFLKSKWNTTENQIELNRDIDYRGGCGKDGDAQEIVWDRKAESAETTTYEKGFTNILKSNHSAFNYPEITSEDAKKIGLFDYPKVVDNKQTSVLGSNNPKLKQHLDFLNGFYGTKYKVRVYTLFFKNKPIDIAFKQEAYWDGGNQNEIVVCVGLKKDNTIDWVKPFSWCDNKRVLIDIREDIMKKEIIDHGVFYHTYLKTIKRNWKYKKFEDFNYLSFEPTTGQLIFVYIMVLLISVGINWWVVNNEFEQ